MALLVHRALLYARLRKIKDLRASLLTRFIEPAHRYSCRTIRSKSFIDRGPHTEKDRGKSSFLVCMDLTGLSPYAYLPLATPKGGWGHVQSAEASCIIFKKDYGTLRLYSGRVGSGESLEERIWAWYTSVSLSRALPYALPVLALWVPVYSCTYHRPSRAFVTTRRRKAAAKSRPRLDDEPASRSTILRRAEKGTNGARVAARAAARVSRLLVGALGFYLLAFHALSNLPLSDPLLYGIHARFWMQPHLALCCFAGLGIDCLLRICGRKSVPLVVVLIALQIRVGLEPNGLSPGAPGGLYSRSLGLHTAHPAHFFGDYARTPQTLATNALTHQLRSTMDVYSTCQQ